MEALGPWLVRSPWATVRRTLGPWGPGAQRALQGWQPCS